MWDFEYPLAFLCFEAWVCTKIMLSNPKLGTKKPALQCAFLPVRENMDQKEPGEERAYFIIHFHITFHCCKAGTQAWSWRQELRQRPSRNPVDWIAKFAFLYSPIPPIQGWQLPMVAGSSHSNHGPRKCPSILTQKPIWWRKFFSWGSLFSRYSSLCDVDQS